MIFATHWGDSGLADAPAIASAALRCIVQIMTSPPPTAPDGAFLRAVLAVFAFDNCDELWWRVDDGTVHLFVNINDVFAWGCADVEEITAGNLHMLEQARADIAAATGERYPQGIGTLFAARVRGMRPQGAVYAYVDERIWPLLDAAGPARSVGFGNPLPQPAPEQQPGA